MTIVDLDIAAPPVDRRPRLAPARSVALFLVGLVTLVLVAGSARLLPPASGALWSAPYARNDDTVTVTPTSLYVFHHEAGVPTLKAYDLATGRVRWSAPSTDVVAQVPAVADGVIVAPDGFETYFELPDLVLARTTRTIARDAHTGTVLWQAAGAPRDVTERAVLLVGPGPDGVPQLRAVGLHDGHTRWSRPAPHLADVVPAGDAVYTAADDGRVTVLRLRDGAVISTAKVRWPDNGRLTLAAGLLVVTARGATGQTSTVYRPDTLAELWRADGALTDCRPLLCGADGAGLLGYDPDTGTRRWRVPGMTVAWPVGAGRIVASSEFDGRSQLLDPATGRPVGPESAGLGSWNTGGRWVVNDAPASSSVFLLREAAAGSNRILRLDVRTGSRYPLGALDGTGWTGCCNVPKFLVCTQDARITVTAVA